jgi:hypothetical protein
MPAPFGSCRDESSREKKRKVSRVLKRNRHSEWGQSVRLWQRHASTRDSPAIDLSYLFQKGAVLLGELSAKFIMSPLQYMVPPGERREGSQTTIEAGGEDREDEDD